MIKLYRYIILFLLVLLASHSKAEQRYSDEVVLKHDTSKNKSTLVAYRNNIFIDSCEIFSVSSELDSLVQINDSLWIYFFKEKRDDFLVNQILLGIVHDKIHFYLICNYLHKLESEVYDFESKIPFTYFKNKYELQFIGNELAVEHSRHFIEYNTLKYTDESERSIWEMEYYPVDRIYFNAEFRLNGVYYYHDYANNFFKEIQFDKLNIKAISFSNALIVYLNEQWYYLMGEKRNILAPALTMPESFYFEQ